MHEKKRIFILGIEWPPSTFLKRKFEILHNSNKFSLVVGVYTKKSTRNTPYKIVRLPKTRDNFIKRLVYLLRHMLFMTLSPKKFIKVLNAARYASKNPKQFFNRLLSYITVANQRFDLVHFEWISHAYYYLPLLKALEKTFSVSARGRQVTIEPLLGKRYNQKLKEVLKHARAVHCVSKALEREIKNIYEHSDTQVIYNGVDITTFKCNPEKSSDGLNVIFIGSLIWRKGIDTALFIFSKYLETGNMGHMYIIGDGEERQKMFSTINNLHLNEQVTYLGKKNEKEVSEILQNMDTLLLPSFAEGLANVILEAMATCTVPIVSDVHGNPEPILHGKNGFVFPLLDVRKPVEFLHYLYTHPGKLYEMKKLARKTIEEKFTLKHMQVGHLKFYERLLS